MMNDVSIVPFTDHNKLSSASTDSLPSTLIPVRDKATALLKNLIKELFSNADDALFEMAERATSNSEQSDLFEAMRDLRLKSAAIERVFLQRVFAGFAQLNQLPAKSRTAPQAQSFEPLSLVHNEALEESVAIDNMVAKVNRRDEQALQLLTARFNHLLHVKITVKDNPLSARALSESFVSSCDSIEFPINVKLIILKLFEKHVLSELTTLYQTTNQLLIAAGVLPDLKSAMPVQKRRSHSTYSTTTPSLEYTTAPAAHPNIQVTLSDLQGMLSELRGTVLPAQHIPADAEPISSHDLMRLLSHMQQHLPTQATLQHDLRAQLDQLLARISSNSESTRVIGQVDDDIINLIAMLFEFILDDHNLPDALKALIARLQIPLLKVAIQDKAFFNRGDHPARLLLNEIAAAALGLNNQAQEQQGSLYQLIENTVQRALTEFTDDPSIFDELLADFVAFTNNEQRRSALLEQRIRDAEKGRARAELARLRVEQALNARLLGKTLPDVIVHLLQDAWSTVLVLTFLKHGEDSKQWHTSLATMDDLIGSAQIHTEPHAQLTQKQLRPSLLQQLHEGFSNAALDPFVTNELFNRLEVLHSEIDLQYEQQAEAATAPTPTSVLDTAQSTAPVEDAHADTAQQGGTQICMLQLNEAFVLQQPDNSDSSPSSVTLSDDDPALLAVDKLHTGSWIEFIQNDEHALRCKLAAISKLTGRYIFVNRSGMKVLEKTRMELAEKFKNNTATVLDDALLFDRALESIIGNLRHLKNS